MEITLLRGDRKSEHEFYVYNISQDLLAAIKNNEHQVNVAIDDTEEEIAKNISQYFSGRIRMSHIHILISKECDTDKIVQLLRYHTQKDILYICEQAKGSPIGHFSFSDILFNKQANEAAWKELNK